MNFRYRGVVFEIQLTLQELLELKSSAHAIYNVSTRSNINAILFRFCLLGPAQATIRTQVSSTLSTVSAKYFKQYFKEPITDAISYSVFHSFTAYVCCLFVVVCACHSPSDINGIITSRSNGKA
jgi:hypothetical protein